MSSDSTDRGAVLEDLDNPDNENTSHSYDEWAPSEELATPGKRLSPFHEKRCSVRGCPACVGGRARNVTPEWSGSNWVCPLCGYVFSPPSWCTYTVYIRCKFCGEPMERIHPSDRCRQCVYEHNRLSSPKAVVNRYVTESERGDT